MTERKGRSPMIGEKVACFCGVYIYTGTVKSISEDEVVLDDPMIVYETGELAEGPWKDAQRLPSPWRVMRHGIESWGPAKC